MATTGYTLNADYWDWTNPDTQKVLRLRRGDTLPAEVVNQEGIDTDEATKGPRPNFLPIEAAARSVEETPKRVEGK
jgi:hypothetical protein